jgi:hypothetical protein
MGTAAWAKTFGPEAGLPYGGTPRRITPASGARLRLRALPTLFFPTIGGKKIAMVDARSGRLLVQAASLAGERYEGWVLAWIRRPARPGGRVFGQPGSPTHTCWCRASARKLIDYAPTA